MLKTLLKKQLFELNRSFFQNRKTGKARSKTMAITSIVLFAALMVLIIGGIFFYLAFQLKPLIEAGVGWLYFLIMGTVAVALGAFGSVFNTYASLYDAKDNDLLLSLPVPVSSIIFTRLAGVYLMGLMYSAVVYIPAMIVFFMTAKPNVLQIAGSLLNGLMISFVVLILSCLLGWVVAWIARRLKNKSLITVIASVAFIAAYYYVYFRANALITTILSNGELFAEKIRGAAYPLYLLGRAGTGHGVSVLIFTAATALLCLLTYLLLAKSFFALAIGASKGTRAVYQEKKARVGTVSAAVFDREKRRFLTSPIYILNCSLGTLFMVIAGAAALIKGDILRDLIDALGGVSDIFAMIVGGVLCMLISMNDITAPSVSMEGKTLWIMQSLPVNPWTVLKAKLKLHMLVTVPSALFCAVCVVIVLRPSLLAAVSLILLSILFTALNAAFGLAINLKLPNLHWTNEAAAVKQGANVFISLFGGWAYAAVLAALYFAVKGFLSPSVYLAVCTALTAVFAAVLTVWLKRRGTKIYATL